MNPKKQKEDALVLDRKFIEIKEDVDKSLKDFRHDTEIELRKFQQKLLDDN